MAASSVSTSKVGPSATIDTVGEDDRAFAQLEGVRQIVSDHQHGHVERAQDVGELAPRRGIEVGGRLVEDEDLGLHRQHGRDGDPAALTEAEVVRGPVGVLAPCRPFPGPS